ncbi:MAG TPA: hypothetical protein H9671_03795 [Firmicutes bacterium]|nr:hypothetical protein [Bacillota bacterium]
MELVSGRTQIEDEDILEEAVLETAQTIRNYCGFEQNEEIPEPLTYVWAGMAVELAEKRARERTGMVDTTGAAQTVKVGDTSVTLRTPHTDSTEELTLHYRQQLNGFRRMNFI